MKGTILIILSLFGGALLGYFYRDITTFDIDTINQWILYALLFAVGISIGSDREFISKIRTLSPFYFLLPLITITGTLLVAFVFTPFLSGL